MNESESNQNIQSINELRTYEKRNEYNFELYDRLVHATLDFDNIQVSLFDSLTSAAQYIIQYEYLVGQY